MSLVSVPYSVPRITALFQGFCPTLFFLFALFCSFRLILAIADPPRRTHSRAGAHVDVGLRSCFHSNTHAPTHTKGGTNIYTNMTTTHAHTHSLTHTKGGTNVYTNMTTTHAYTHTHTHTHIHTHTHSLAHKHMLGQPEISIWGLSCQTWPMSLSSVIMAVFIFSDGPAGLGASRGVVLDVETHSAQDIQLSRKKGHTVH